MNVEEKGCDKVNPAFETKSGLNASATQML